MKTGCKSHYCFLTGYRSGMCTNMTCNCLNELTLGKRIAVQRRINSLELALKNMIDITEKHHRSPHDLIIRDKYNAIKSEAKQLVGLED